MGERSKIEWTDANLNRPQCLDLAGVGGQPDNEHGSLPAGLGSSGDEWPPGREGRWDGRTGHKSEGSLRSPGN